MRSNDIYFLVEMFSILLRVNEFIISKLMNDIQRLEEG